MLLQENLYEIIITPDWCKIIADVAMNLVTKRKGTYWNVVYLIESILNIAFSNAVKYINCQNCMSIGEITKWSEEYGLYWCDKCSKHSLTDNKKLHTLGKYANEVDNKLTLLSQYIKNKNESSVIFNMNDSIDKFLFDTGLFPQKRKSILCYTPNISRLLLCKINFTI
jgi:hypothetical protein